jgi:hypothetical protein
MLWEIRAFPRCTHHIFLSHCAEDRRWLLPRLLDGLKARGIIPWLDRHDYPYGRASFEALRDGILRCRHVAFLVTPAMLDQARGWTVVELAWAELLQANFQIAGGALQTVALPLCFVQASDPRIPRSVWNVLRDKAAFHDPAKGDAVDWAIQSIETFLYREQEKALDLALLVQQDGRLRTELASRPGLRDRVESRFP